MLLEALLKVFPEPTEMIPDGPSRLSPVSMKAAPLVGPFPVEKEVEPLASCAPAPDDTVTPAEPALTKTLPPSPSPSPATRDTAPL